MSRFNNTTRYTIDELLSDGDSWLVSDINDSQATKTFTLGAVKDYITEKTLIELGLAPAYLTYVVNMSQSGTNDPIVVELSNSLSGAIVWTRTGTGAYLGTLTGAFLTDKVVTFVGGDRTLPDSTIMAYRASDNTIQIITNTEFTGADGVLNNTSIEIRVYP